MTIADRERLLRRIRQISRSVAPREPTDSEAADSEPARLQSLEARVAHLEQLLEGLQDSVHRESERHAAMIAELQTQVEPSTMGAAIAEDARHRRL